MRVQSVSIGFNDGERLHGRSATMTVIDDPAAPPVHPNCKCVQK